MKRTHKIIFAVCAAVFMLILNLSCFAGEEHIHKYKRYFCNPTCTETAYNVYRCECGDSYTVDLPSSTPHGHAFSAWLSVDKNAAGENVLERTCIYCGEKETKGQQHPHDYKAVSIAPTCTSAGSTKYTCSCGQSYSVAGAAAMGHSWNNGVVTTPATTTTTGIKTYTCSNCGSKKSEIFSKSLHSHVYVKKNVSATCTTDGYSTYTCACGDSYKDNVVKALSHYFGVWTVTKKATATEKGSESRTCARCGYKETRVIAKLGSTTTPSGTDTAEKKLPVKNILQKPQLPNGCEIVSLAIVLNYYKYDVDAVWLSDNYLEKGALQTGNPFTSYLGDPKVIRGGYGCYAPCIVSAANKYLGDVKSDKQAYDVSCEGLSAYEKYIDQGIPVILWGLVKMNGNQALCEYYVVNGETIIWRLYSHCFVLIGYTDTTYILADPLVGIAEYSKKAVQASYDLVYEQAVIVK